RMRVARLGFAPGESHGRGEPGDAGQVFRASTAFLLLAPTQQHWLPWSAVADVEQADAFGAVELMRGDAQEIHAEVRRRDVDRSGRLHGVRMDYDVRVLRPGDPGDFGNWLERAHFVVRGHDADHGRLSRDRFFERAQIDKPIAIDREVGRREAFSLKLFDRMQDRMMFDGRRDYVTATAARALGEGSTTDGSVV